MYSEAQNDDLYSIKPILLLTRMGGGIGTGQHPILPAISLFLGNFKDIFNCLEPSFQNPVQVPVAQNERFILVKSSNFKCNQQLLDNICLWQRVFKMVEQP